MELSKEQTLQCIKEIRELWCEWDPIGVTVDSEWPQDEYDNYLMPCLILLDSGASNKELEQYLEFVVATHMGLGQDGLEYSKPMIFAKKLSIWFNERKKICNYSAYLKSIRKL